ncbi:MAG TPA: DNA polymerase I [Anaerolineae bacterium]|nr:DNA polymerase I [Anaerolineae bacterium]HQH38312.1 DNA polymerase I [Anaerolineae bacterium]
MTQKLVLVDGHSLAYRAFHALPPEMKTSTGELTNASYGFAAMLFNVLADENPDYVIVTFDKGPSFRTRDYAEYKAHREKMPPEMRGQMERIREIVTALGIPIVELEDYEADDLLGTLALQATQAGLDVVIVTGDRDALQLVDERTTVLTSGRRFSDTLRYTPEMVREKYGLEPHQLIDLKALTGDPSDNIPGVPGVGEKGGIALLQKYGSLDGIYAHLDELPPRYRSALAENRDLAYLSQRLGRIVRDVPVTPNLTAARTTWDYDRERVLSLLQQLEFRSLLRRLPGMAAAPTTTTASMPAEGQQLPLFGAMEPAPLRSPAIIPGLGDYHLVADENALAQLAAQLEAASAVAVDTETTGTDALLADLVGISITDREGAAWYIPVRAPEGEAVICLETVVHHLGPLLANPASTKLGHNLKYDIEVLKRHGFDIAGPLFDTMVAEWVLNPDSGNLGLKNQAWARLGLQMTEISALIGTGRNQKTMDQVPLAQVVPYACADADVAFRLVHGLRPELEKRRQTQLFTDLEMPLLPVLVDMEMTGVKLDVDWLATLSADLTERLRNLEQEIYHQAGVEFNINSTQQLSDVLFKRLGLPTRGIGKTKSGHYSTRAGVLEDLAGAHPVVDAILAHRELSKLKSTYVEALPQLINPQTGRVHTSYNQTGTVTGRLSSSNPNLQNIPIRSPEGRRVRRAFIAEPGRLLISADYSQIELRVMAHVSHDEGLIGAFERGEDIHATTAAAIYGVPLAEVTYDQRRIAKAVNFGLIYGQSAYGLSRQIGISVEEAEAFIKRYFERFPRAREYMERVQREVVEQGYVETLLQRRRFFPELAPDSQLSAQARQAAVRMAINTPIQGSAADIMKLAMLRTHRMVRERQLRARMILQVHDELVLEAPEDERAAVIALLHEAMGQALPLIVPLKVDIEVGNNWEEMGSKQ